MGTITARDGKKSVKCIVRRGKRKKTMAMRIEPSGQVTVMIPRFLDIALARRFVENKINWVNKLQKLRREMAVKYPKREFVSGETFSIFGRNYRLNIKSSKNARSRYIEHNRLIVNIYPVTRERIKETLEELLRKHYRLFVSPPDGRHVHLWRSRLE